MHGGNFNEPQEHSTTSTSQNQEQDTEQQVAAIISTAHRLSIASSLKTLKMEIEAQIRQLETPHARIALTDLGNLERRYNDLLETLWNP